MRESLWHTFPYYGYISDLTAGKANKRKTWRDIIASPFY